jgi:transposase InsO family protein
MVYTFIKITGKNNKELFMPWRSKSVKELREDFINHVIEFGNISASCRHFGITRRTGYKWLSRHRSKDSLENQSRKPKRHSNQTDHATEALILSVRGENPAWGGRKIHDYLSNKGEKSLPCPRTFCNILKRNGCISPEESLKHQAYQRFEREHCNELWQTDYKGDFLLKDGSRCYPLTILDDRSRYSIMIDCKSDTKGTIDSFRLAFNEYGKPDSILSDNGSQFRGFQGGYTQFERWLMEHNILPIHGRIGRPQTQGKVERFHRTMKEELLNHHQFKDIHDIREQMKIWQNKYNNERPHLSLNSRCPSDVYVPSTRKYCEKVDPYNYDGTTYKVNNRGYLRFANFQVYLSETMANTVLEIRESSSQDAFNIYFRNFKIAKIDAQEGKLKSRKISRQGEE